MPPPSSINFLVAKDVFSHFTSICHLCEYSTATITVNNFFDHVICFNSLLKCTSRLNVFYQNVRGLRTKFDFSELTYLFSAPILSETWLSPDIHISELGLTNHQVFRLDINNNNSCSCAGGGFLMAVKSSYRALYMISTNPPNLEELIILAPLLSIKTVFSAIYLSPNILLYLYKTHVNVVEQLIF